MQKKKKNREKDVVAYSSLFYFENTFCARKPNTRFVMKKLTKETQGESILKDKKVDRKNV